MLWLLADAIESLPIMLVRWAYLYNSFDVIHWITSFNVLKRFVEKLSQAATKLLLKSVPKLLSWIFVSMLNGELN